MCPSLTVPCFRVFFVILLPLVQHVSADPVRSRNSSVAGRVAPHSLQTGMGRKNRSHRDGCIHMEFFQPARPRSTGTTLVIMRPWSSLPRDPLPGPGMPWAHSSLSFLLGLLHPLPLYSALTQMTMKPARRGLLWKVLCKSAEIFLQRYSALSLPKEQPPRQ